MMHPEAVLFLCESQVSILAKQVQDNQKLGVILVITLDSKDTRM